VDEDAETKRFKVRMNDFGCRKFRSECRSYRHFRKLQAREDEEGAVGLVMERKLGGGFVYRGSAYGQELLDEFHSEA
jgi:hypothetical protein